MLNLLNIYKGGKRFLFSFHKMLCARGGGRAASMPLVAGGGSDFALRWLTALGAEW